MKLNYITIMVRDLEKSIDFYQNLVGLQVVRRFQPNDADIAFMNNHDNETMLELIHIDNAKKVSTEGMVMSFCAGTQLTQMREKAIALGYQPTEIIDHQPKPKYFRLNDPDGIVVEFSIE